MYTQKEIEIRKIFLLDIVIKAGDIVSTYIDKEKHLEFKGKVDLVTEADKKTEEFILSAIENKFPEDSFIAEENGEKQNIHKFCWIIDPIDGTTSCYHNFPIFAVSIALADSNLNALLATVYNPYYKELFFAQKDKGAFIKNIYKDESFKKIQVSSTHKIQNALISTGFPYNRQKHLDRVLKLLKEVLMQCRDIRRTGSASMDICFVAMGRCDAYFEESLKIWDVAAANLILEEAGGRISQYNEEIYKPYDYTIVVSNQLIHQQLTSILKNFL